jgi:hypothetical protein
VKKYGTVLAEGYVHEVALTTDGARVVICNAANLETIVKSPSHGELPRPGPNCKLLLVTAEDDLWDAITEEQR